MGAVCWEAPDPAGTQVDYDFAEDLPAPDDIKGGRGKNFSEKIKHEDAHRRRNGNRDGLRLGQMRSWAGMVWMRT